MILHTLKVVLLLTGKPRASGDDPLDFLFHSTTSK